MVESGRDSQETDVWSDWLLHRRHADDPAYAGVIGEVMERVADRVLDEARLTAGATLIDVGAGEGLLAFRALARVGPSLRVALTDISAPMLRHAEAAAERLGVRSQCTFHECSAEKLGALSDASADVVVTRAVLAYVSDKSAALREFFRVLKPGGRISLAEPILQDDAFYARALRQRVEAQAVHAHRPFLTALAPLESGAVPRYGGGLRQEPDRQLLRTRSAPPAEGLRLCRDPPAIAHR